MRYNIINILRGMMKIEELYDYLKNNQITNIDELIGNLTVSESTIRRRLKKMQQIGLIHLAHGGKIKLVSEPNISVSDDFRFTQNQINKVQIAKIAASYVEDEDVIFIDNGTTVRHMLKYLAKKNVTIYTNGYVHIDTAKEYGINLNIIPGVILPSEASIVGEAALMYLSQINFDKAFVGANGYSKTKGITTPNLSECNLKRHALEVAFEGYVLIDATKENLVSKYKICDLDSYNLIIK